MLQVQVLAAFRPALHACNTSRYTCSLHASKPHTCMLDFRIAGIAAEVESRPPTPSSS